MAMGVTKGAPDVRSKEILSPSGDQRGNPLPPDPLNVNCLDAAVDVHHVHLESAMRA